MFLWFNFIFHLNNLYLNVVHAVSEERCDEVESLVFDLFANLGATGAKNCVENYYSCIFFTWLILVYLNITYIFNAEEQLDFPVLYASAKEGWASSTFTKNPPDDAKNMSELLDAIVRHVRPPTASLDEPFQMMVGIKCGVYKPT